MPSLPAYNYLSFLLFRNSCATIFNLKRLLPVNRLLSEVLGREKRLAVGRRSACSTGRSCSRKSQAKLSVNDDGNSYVPYVFSFGWNAEGDSFKIRY